MHLDHAGDPQHLLDGDHMGFMLEPVAGYAPDGMDELVSFSDVRDLEPGHEP